MSNETIAAVALAGAALVLALAAVVQVGRVRRRLDAVPEDGSVFDAIRRLDEDLGSVEEAVVALQPVVASLSQRMPGAVRHVGVVRYDAYADRAGQLSRSIALLNERGDGMVITLMVGRSDTNFFTKMVRGGQGAEPLSPEEQEAVTRAASA